MNKIIESYGWDGEWQEKFEAAQAADGVIPARVTADYGHLLEVSGFDEPLPTAGKLLTITDKSKLPKIGDWVCVDSHEESTVILDSLPRRTELARRSPKEHLGRQVMAANVDIAFIVHPVQGKPNTKQLGRFVYQVYASGIRPVIILNKIDTSKEWVTQYDEITDEFPDLEVLGISALQGDSIDALEDEITQGQTAVLLGPSGVGKSTIINALVGSEIQETQPINERGYTGRHTTTTRKMFILKNGGLLIDSPGIRDIKLWISQEQVDDIFSEINTTTSCCQYSDCQHIDSQVGCAVTQALEDGIITKKEWLLYLDLSRQASELTEEKQLQRQTKIPKK
jgi:ribosome biogenesis GTPase / thiamine phosphate phosphatase